MGSQQSIVPAVGERVLYGISVDVDGSGEKSESKRQ